MFAYDETFDPKVFVDHNNLISLFSEFAFYSISTISWYFFILLSYNEYDQTYTSNVILGHYDLISWFSDFALYLNTQWVCDHNFFQIMGMTRPLILKFL